MSKRRNEIDETIWKTSIISPVHFLPSLEETVYAVSGDIYPSITEFEIKDDKENRLMEIYYDHEPDIQALKNAVKEMASILNTAPPEIKLERLENTDWVAESQKILKPIDAGRFYLYGNHDIESVPDHKISILMEAGQAFGTGSHETTNGCLLAISDLYGKINPVNILDLGCGSGVLAIAMAKQWDSKIIASDIDPIATETASENIALNNVTGIQAITCDGFENSALTESAPYDMIVANILAEPLRMLAHDIISNLKEKGIIILSGLLKEQENSVLEVYEKENMELVDCFPINEWQTLVLRKK